MSNFQVIAANISRAIPAPIVAAEGTNYWQPIVTAYLTYSDLINIRMFRFSCEMLLERNPYSVADC